MVHLAIANFTGSLRLLTGLGWPMIYGVAAFYSIKKRRRRLGSIRLHDEHSVEVLGLLPPLVYFVVIWAKGSLSLVDSAILAATYIAYLWILLRMPPRADAIGFPVLRLSRSARSSARSRIRPARRNSTAARSLGVRRLQSPRYAPPPRRAARPTAAA